MKNENNYTNARRLKHAADRVQETGASDLSSDYNRPEYNDDDDDDDGNNWYARNNNTCCYYYTVVFNDVHRAVSIREIIQFSLISQLRRDRWCNGRGGRRRSARAIVREELPLSVTVHIRGYVHNKLYNTAVYLMRPGRLICIIYIIHLTRIIFYVYVIYYTRADETEIKTPRAAAVHAAHNRKYIT